MTRDEILEVLAGEISDLPSYPEPDTDAAVNEYDETLNVGLEILRDTVESILMRCGYYPEKGENDEA